MSAFQASRFYKFKWFVYKRNNLLVLELLRRKVNAIPKKSS